MSADFAINNKIYLTTKVSPFMAKYRRELKIGVDLRKKGKMEKAIEFAERIRKIQKKAGAALKRVQEEIKWQVNKEWKKAKVWKIGNRLMLSMKDLVFKGRPVKKLVD